MSVTPNDVVRSLADKDLRQSVVEALDWRKKGVLTGQALREVARRLETEAGVEDFDATRMADALVVEEAAIRFVCQA